MYRALLRQLLSWGDSALRKPLVLRGARQVGKSWMVAEFGKQFEHFITINFEKEKKAKQWFEGDINIKNILQTISLQKQQPLIPGKTLLFLDEIQECEEALQTLRYFKEELPELHVIAAGSLLDFAIEKVGMPVGRVQFMYLYPISFSEFLTIMGRDDLKDYIAQQSTEATVHHLLLDYVKTYMYIGGMPAVVQQWKDTKDYVACQMIQDEIIESYQQDFYKYAKTQQIPYVTKVFENISLQLGCKFIYSHVDRDIRSLYFKTALDLLSKAGIAHICNHTSAQSQPLGAMIDERKFKTFFFDIGIVQRLLGLDIKQWFMQPLKLNNIGAVSEQFVAQELIAYSPYRKKANLYYWHREAKSSNAEIDFITIKEGQLIPIEVKSATRGRLRSMHSFLESHPASPYGLKISECVFAHNGQLLEIPFYAIESWLVDK